MKMNEYQELARKSALYPPEVGVAYTILGLVNEAGEVAGKYKKFLREDYDGKEAVSRIIPELGDVLWYLAMSCAECGTTLEAVAKHNLAKLAGRMEAGTIQGDGDYR